ncbi:Rv2253/PknI dimerization domain-containing protein [Mycolicibacterium gadium]|uniref:Secreted protein n=1 Tax=Mycolicibacterium gadium TaxID=1794 RepID=A0ABT6GQX6_MYCGU|nr:hypothetical protein [Mycolicibacterium gadium]MDG5483984.1 hypothetical protein [Mycolicibacterium gadium]
MRGYKIAGGVVTALTVAATVGTIPTAHASDFGMELNGTYHYHANGDIALVNDVKKQMPTIDETWTLSSSCVSPVECEGTATSSAGWSARLWYGYPNTYWVVDRNIPEWQFCPGGGVAPGEQRFQFSGVDVVAEESNKRNTNFLVGRQRTLSPSGSCGTNKPLVIETPMLLERLS